MPQKQLNTGTAADLLTYETVQHVTKNVERLTRVATASQEWVVKDWDGEVYSIKFDKNFSKKHLFTFSKDTEKTKAQAHIEAKKPGQSGKDLENWHNAEIALLTNKIAKNIDKRAVADVCACGHKLNPKHMHVNPAGGNKIMGPCKDVACTAALPPCTVFETPYGIARRYVGKPTYDPLSGAKTSKNSCIILNWVPKTEFEQVIVKSIQDLEKPPGWKKGDALSVGVGAEHVLRWDFGLARRGAIVLADYTVVASPIHTNYQGCYVKARKAASTVGRQTWEIFHMEGAPAHPLF